MNRTVLFIGAFALIMIGLLSLYITNGEAPGYTYLVGGLVLMWVGLAVRR